MNIKLCMLYLTAEIVIALETNLLYLHKKNYKNIFGYQEENTNAWPILDHIIIYQV